jgi:nitroreductase
MKKSIFIALVFVCIIAVSIFASSKKVPAETVNTDNDFVGFITSLYSPRQYTDKAINDDIITQILAAGHKAPSARNGQPWHFTVVKNNDITKQIMPSIVNNNVLIVVSGQKDGMLIDFDCGLATQNMFLAAQALGLGSRIYLMGVDKINKEMMTTLHIPDNHKAIMVLRIGYIDESVDATTAASPRQELNTKINFIP